MVAAFDWLKIVAEDVVAPAVVAEADLDPPAADLVRGLVVVPVQGESLFQAVPFCWIQVHYNI